MPRRSVYDPDLYYCQRHRTRSERVAMECPSCRHPIHFHNDQIALAKRGLPIREKCSYCKIIYGLVGVSGKARVTVSRIENGAPAIQLALKG